MSVASECAQVDAPLDRYPMPWSLDDDGGDCANRRVPSSRDGRKRNKSRRGDENASVMDRWFREFIDDQTGASCPPPMN